MSNPSLLILPGDGIGPEVMAEVRKIIDENYSLAEKLLAENIDKLHVMAKALIKYETIGEEQIKDIMEGRDPRPPEDWDDTNDSDEDKGSSKTEVEPKGSIGGPASEH